MYFDGTAHHHGVGAGIVFVTLDGGILLYSFTLNQHCSNNVAEYQALIFGREIAVDMEQLELQIYGDSQLVVNQLLGRYEVKKSELIPYHKYTTRLMKRFGGVSIKHVPRRENKQADALAVLASSLAMPDHEIQSHVYQKWVVPSLIDDEDIEGSDAHVVSTYEIDKEDWRQPLVDYFKYQKLPDEQRRRTDIRRRASRFILYKNTLLMDKLCEKFNFKQRKSSMYNAPANGLAEAFNKTLCNLLKKVVARSKKDWHERIGETLWTYHTTYRIPTQATPYALVYGVEAVLPFEQQIPSLRIAIQEGLTEEENVRLRLEELEVLDEKRLEAQQNLECYQARLSRTFNKKVRRRSFQVGDMILAVRNSIVMTHRTKDNFVSKWDGPYVVREIYTNGAYKLVDKDGVKVGPINEKFMKLYMP
ncbi:uncharacterized protein [Coffea arabica]|uniref:RNase H type-1 domain-containing protein n=1 Tax=Coffea arabica TaxID=13443 RepID=A0ABM4W2P7_COFAR